MTTTPPRTTRGYAAYRPGESEPVYRCRSMAEVLLIAFNDDPRESFAWFFVPCWLADSEDVP